jgi:hypothetical protein
MIGGRICHQPASAWLHTQLSAPKTARPPLATRRITHFNFHTHQRSINEGRTAICAGKGAASGSGGACARVSGQQKGCHPRRVLLL